MNDTENLKEPAAVSAIWTDSKNIGFTMASDPLTGSLLRTLAASKPGGRFLELGSGTGLSTAWILDGMQAGATLTTVDNDEGLLAVLRANLTQEHRLSVVCADGDDYVRSLTAEPGKTFDFIFADTWSGKYRLLEECLSLLAPAGFYVIDDMLPQANWPEGHADKASTLVAALEARRDLHTTKLSWASGIIICTKHGV